MATNKNFIVKNGLEVDGNTLHVDPDNNRVGIKTNSPSYDLDVNGTSRFVGNVNLDNELIIDNTNSKGLTVTGGDGDTYSHITLSGAGPQKIKFLDTSNAQGLDLVYRTTSDELKIENGSAYTLFSASRDDGSIKLYYGNSLKFQTTNTGVTVTGTALASQLSTGTSGTGINITTNSITGPSTITLDPAGVGDNTGTVVIAGNLQVDGTTTTINSTVVTVSDLNLTLASGAINAAAANNAGIVINGANASLTYVAVKDSLNFNKSVVINNDDNGGHAAYTSSAALRVDGNDGVGLFVTGNEQSADPVAIFYKNDDVFNVPAVIISGDANNGEQSIFDVRGRANQSTADLSATSNSADTIFDVRGDGNVYARGNIYAGGRYGQTNYRVLTVNDEGSGNGLDADLLDGLNTSSTDTSGNSVVTRSSGNFSAGTITASLQARTAVTTWRDHGVSAFTDAPIISRSNTEDNWIYCDIANAQWGIYHRNIDSVLTVSGQPSLPANSIAFVGNNNLTSYIELGTGNIYSISNVSSNTLTSRVATGTAPLTVSSTTVVTNLNADLLDGWNSTGYVQLTEASTNWNNYHHPGGEYYTAVHGGANNHNNFIHEGFYHVDPTGGANNPTNTYAYLRVHRHRNSNYGLQIHYPSGDASYFEMRQAYDSSGSRLWTNWFTYPSLERNNTWSGSQLFTGTIGDSPTGTSGVWVGKSASGDGQIQLVGNSAHIDFANATEDFDMRIIRSGDDVLQVQGGALYLENDLRLTGSSPTIALIDTDHATASLHVNSNVFYILRNAANTASWAQVDGTWPFEISLINNDALFGRTVTSNAYQNIVKFKANWRNDNVTALASSYNFILNGDNDAGSRLVCFINSSTRTADGGANAVTFRNDGGPLNLGAAAHQTNIFGPTLFDRNTPAISNSSYAVGQNHIELRTTDASNPILGFHRSGHTATALYHAGYGINSLRMKNADGNDGPIFSTFNDGAGSGLDADLLDGLNSATANTASTIVARDASGNFSAGTITAALTGNASTATTLQTTRTIWGQNFNGSANVTGALSSVTTIDASSDISLGGELNFGGTPSGKIIDFYTKNSGGTNFSATMRLVNHDSTSFHNAIVMQRESSVDLYHNNSLRLNTASDGVRIIQSSGYWTGFAPQNNYVSASLEGGCYIDFRNELGFVKSSIHNIFFTDGASELRFFTTAAGIARGADTRTLGFTLWSNGVTNFSQAIHVPQNNNATGGGINFNGAGNTFIRGRNQDGASSTLSNLQLQSWYGIGFGPTISGQTVPQGENAFWINVRDGGWGSRGSGVVGGTLGVNGQTPTAGYEFDVNGDARLTGNLLVSAGNTTGGGIILADDGDIVDLNDSFCSMRFSGGVRIYSANKGGTPAITLANTGAITANYLTVNAQNAAAGEGGEITLAKSSVGSLAGNVIIDVNGDALRIFESNSPFRGVLLNITACGSQSTLWHANNDGAGSGLDADLLDGKNTGTSGNTIPLLDGDNTWSTRQTFSGGIIPGSTQGYPNYESLVEFNADAAGTWRRIINATLQDILYSTIGFKIEITDPKANHAPIATVDSIITETYYVACVRTEGTTTNVPDACYVRGPGNRIRATKTSTGVYQIQIQNEAQYREYRVNISVYAVNGSHAITYHAGDTASAGTAQYNASVSTTSEHVFQNVEARQFISATTNSNQAFAGQHLVDAPFYNTFSQTGSQYQAIVKGRCTGSTTTDIMSFGNLHNVDGSQNFVFQRIRSDGSNPVFYSLSGASGSIWHTANDGAGSGLDADLLDGKNTGTSGNTIPLLDGSNTWSAQQSFTARILMNSAAGERQIAFNNGTTDVYYYGNSSSVGLYDGTNVRHIWRYEPSGNLLVVDRTTRFVNSIGLDAGQSLFFGREESFSGSDTGGADYGYIIWDNDNNTYNTGGAGDSTENGCLRIGTENDQFTVSNDNLALEPTNDLWLYPRGGRVHFHKKNSTGGGQNTFTGLDAPSGGNGRGQFVLSSSYSDLVIASSQGNNDHGSTLTFATYDPSNTANYRKFVVNQGNWGTRAGYLDFGYSDANSRTNPHSNINTTDCVMTLDGYNKRVGIGPSRRSPGSTLDVAGEARFIADNAIVATGTNISDDVWGGSIEIREINQVGNTQTGSSYAPGITFHWANVAASAIKMYNDGSIRFVAQNSTGSSYRPIHANQFISNVATGTAPLTVSSTTVVTNLTSQYCINTTQGFNSNWNTDFQAAPAGSTILRGDTSSGSSTGGPGGTWWFQQNMRHTNSSNFWGVQVAWGWEDNANRLRTRNVGNGSYGGWINYWNDNNDGAGSGLDADLLDGFNSDRFLRSLGHPGYGDWNTFGNAQQTVYEILQENFNVGTNTGSSNFPGFVSYRYGTLINFGANSSARAQVYISHAGNDLIFRGGWGTASWQTWNRVWTDINDGSGSGLDADLLDGQQGSFYTNASNITSGTLPVAQLLAPVSGNWHRGVGLIGGDGVMEVGRYIDFHTSNVGTTDFDVRLSAEGVGDLRMNGSTMWTSGNDGAGSGLDADLLDGLNATSANTGSTIVARDASGNFSAGTITATLSGNATTATTASNASQLSFAASSATSTRYFVFTDTLGGNSGANVNSGIQVVPSTGNITLSSGNITLSNGNIVIGTSGRGIDFSATANAASGSATSELLSDYEEGTWTPNATGVGWGGSATYTTRSGTYTKIGRIVVVNWLMNINVATAFQTAPVEVLGLPFTCAVSDTFEGEITIDEATSTSTNINIVGIVGPNNTLVRLYYKTATGLIGVRGTDLGNSPVISGTITYFAQ